jgi:asparagine synthase (glutamine-hydrolysing)
MAPDLWKAALAAFDPVDHIAVRAGGMDQGVFSWVSHAELGVYTRDQLLRDTDVMSMAHSLEVRVPLLDDWLVETALRLPDAAKRDGGRPKHLLLEVVGPLLPTAVRARRGKQGFTFPFDAWLRGPLRNHCEDWRTRLADILRADQLDRVRDAWQTRRIHWSRAWALAALVGWRTAAH